MHFDLHILSLVLLTGLAAGYMDGIAGGGGLLTVPMLLSIGLPPHLALGTNKLAGTMGVLQSVRVFIKKNILNVRLWIPAIIGALIGSACGAIAVQLIHADFLKQLIPCVLIIIVAYMLLPKPAHRYKHRKDFKPKLGSSAAISSSVGFYDGFFGPGTGAIGVALIVASYKLDLLQASAAGRLINFTSNIAALIVFIVMGNVNYLTGISMGAAYMVGSYFGVHSAIKFGTKFIKPIFLIVTTIICVRLITTT